MAGKRRSVVGENRPKRSASGSKKKKVSAAGHKKQTSLLSFWGNQKLKKQEEHGTKHNPKPAIAQDARERTNRPLPSPKLGPTDDPIVPAVDGNPNSNQNNVNDAHKSETTEGVTSAQKLVAKTQLETIDTTKIESPSMIVTVTPNKKEWDEIVCHTIEDDDDHDHEEATQQKPTNQNIERSGADEKNGESCTESPPPIAPNASSEESKPKPCLPNEDGLSEYEKLRLRNIERNNARLAALGLLAPSDGLSKPKKTASTRRARPPRKTPAVHKTRQQPLRRSSRNRNPSKGSRPAPLDDNSDLNFAAINAETSNAPELEEEEELYTVSPLLQYEMERHLGEEKRNSNPSGLEPTDETASMDTPIGTLPKNSSAVKKKTLAAPPSYSTSLAVSGTRFLPPKGLSAIYSLDFWRNKRSSHWLAGAGKAGMIALWDTSQEVDPCDANDCGNDLAAFVDPVLSWKAHSGRWIADARFVSAPKTASVETKTENAPSRLLTAGNDGTVCLWDLSAVSASNGAPRLLQRTGKEYHGSGIFCMDAGLPDRAGSDTVIATGSKDKTVAVSTLGSIAGGGASALPVWRSRFHTAKVGAVRLKDSSSPLLASASDDGIVAVHDHRAEGSSPVARIGDAHDRPHSVVWDPCHEFVLVTAGLDPVVRVWDRRNLSAPVASLEGHVPTRSGRIRRIHRPSFFGLPPSSSCASERFLLTGGQGSSFVSVYRLGYPCDPQQPASSSLFSRGRLPADCGESGSMAVNGREVAVAVDQGNVILLKPSVAQDESGAID